MPQVPSAADDFASRKEFRGTERALRRGRSTLSNGGHFLSLRQKQYNLTTRQRMERKLRTKRGKKLYRSRRHKVEPVFGQIKGARRFTRLLLRGATERRQVQAVVRPLYFGKNLPVLCMYTLYSSPNSSIIIFSSLGTRAAKPTITTTAKTIKTQFAVTRARLVK